MGEGGSEGSAVNAAEASAGGVVDLSAPRAEGDAARSPEGVVLAEGKQVLSAAEDARTGAIPSPLEEALHRRHSLRGHHVARMEGEVDLLAHSLVLGVVSAVYVAPGQPAEEPERLFVQRREVHEAEEGVSHHRVAYKGLRHYYEEFMAVPAAE